MIDILERKSKSPISETSTPSILIEPFGVGSTSRNRLNHNSYNKNKLRLQK